MKAIILSAIAISLLVIAVSLMLGAPQSVLANQEDTEQEAGIGSDKMGRVCDFGPNQDQCYDQFLERTHNLPELPPNQHYGTCEERGDNNTLACDILNDTASPNPADSAYQSGFKHGVSDAKCVHQSGCDYYITKPGNGFAFHSKDFIDGFITGYCSIIRPPSFNGTDIGFDSSQASFSCIQGFSSANWEITK